MYKAIASHFRNKFGAGLAVLVPLAITFLVLHLLTSWIDRTIQPLFELTLGRRLPGAGLALSIILIYLTGLLTTNIIGRWLLNLGQKALMRIPIVKTIYYTSRQLVNSFSSSEIKGFKRVVAVEYPRPGIWTIGFVTGSTKNEEGRVFSFVYLPTTPNPTSGWVILVPEEQTHELDLSVPDAVQLIISGGIISPSALKGKKI